MDLEARSNKHGEEGQSKRCFFAPLFMPAGVAGLAEPREVASFVKNQNQYEKVIDEDDEEEEE